MEATQLCPKFQGDVKFTGSSTGSKGKQLDNKATREAVSWQPKHPSFKHFMAEGGVDVYSLEDAWSA